jgi:hypothetical protein
MPDKTPQQIEQEEADNRRQREQLAKEANQKRNEARLDRLNAIADNAESARPDELTDMTDEAWREMEDQADTDEDAPPAKRRAATDEDPDATLEETAEERTVRRRAEAADRELDEAREAGADDIRRTEAGKVQYRVGGEWLTLAQLRELGGDARESSSDEDLHADDGESTNTDVRAPSPDPAEKRRLAEQAKQERKARYRDLQLRASMGDEAAIDELAEVMAGMSDTNSDDLQQLVIQTVDARVQGRSAFESAVTWFESEYKAELGSPRLKKMAAKLDRELADANPQLDPKSRLKRVGEEIRAIRRELTGDDAPAPRLKTSAKELRKRALPTIPEAAGRERPEVEPDEVVSTSDAIAAMARGRGQARAIKH